jgi:hypothetical protein
VDQRAALDADVGEDDVMVPPPLTFTSSLNGALGGSVRRRR